MYDDPAAQIVTVVIDLITDKKHTHFVKALDDLNPNSGNDKYGLEANLKLGRGLKYPRAVPAILLLREAVNKGWKEMLAKDVAAAEQARRDAPDDSDDDDLPDMT